MMRSWKVMLVVSVATTGGLLWSQDAKACSGPACLPEAKVAPAEGKSIPANLPAVVVAFALESRPPELLDPAGAVVPAQVTFANHQWLLRPDAQLTPGETYTLSHDGQCPGEPEGDFESTFTATAAAPLPTVLGALSVKEEGTSVISVPAGGSCVTEAEAAHRSYTFTPDASLEPWLPLVAWRLVVNGEQWTRTQHGSMGKEHVLQHDLLRVYALCDQATQTDAHRGLEEGVHTVELQGFLPGADTPFATVSDSVELSCERPSLLRGPGQGCASTGPTPGLAGLGALWVALRASSRRRAPGQA